MTLDLSKNTYKPFIKTDQYPSYIDVNSNHPKTITKQVPKAVNLGIGNLSANDKIFQESSKLYKDALRNSGFREEFGPAVRVFANGPRDLGSIPGRVIPKTFKMELDTTLLNTQHYKVRFKGKVEQSWEWSSALPYTLV